MDGHDRLAAALMWGCKGSDALQAVPMQSLGNDRWQTWWVPPTPADMFSPLNHPVTRLIYPLYLNAGRLHC